MALLTRMLSEGIAGRIERLAVNAARGRTTNVGPTERSASRIAGGALLALGLARRSFPGLAIAALGASLVYRAATGHCAVKEKLGVGEAA
jgi:uncharacterized membrane protein